MIFDWMMQNVYMPPLKISQTNLPFAQLSQDRPHWHSPPPKLEPPPTKIKKCTPKCKIHKI